MEATPMATLTGVQSKIAGTAVTYVSASGGGDKFSPGDHREFRVKNGATASTLSIAVPGTAKYGGAFPVASGTAITIAANTEYTFGPFPSDLAQSDGYVAVTYGNVTTLTVAVVDC
jgi:hypothetical protein